MARRVAKYGKLGPIYELIPRPAYRFARALYLDLKSIPRRLSGNNPGPEPWLVFHNFGGSDFYESGAAASQGIQRQLGLGPSSRVLDIGCGSGRLAWPLHDVLSGEGAYIGFDVSANAVAFARRLMSGHEDRFSFHHANLFSKEYNPQSLLQAKDYRFPCEDSWADGAWAISVFTHLLEEDAAHYLKELSRTLKPDGKAYLTAYLVNDEIQERMAAKKSMLTMQRYKGPVWAGDMDVPEAATGYDEDAFLAMMNAAGLELEDGIRRGGWSLTKGATYTQDVFIVRRSSA